jgi:hypothetical protein
MEKILIINPARFLLDKCDQINAFPGDVVLIKAECSAGKTTYITKKILKESKAALYLAPLRVIVSQQEQSFLSSYSPGFGRQLPVFDLFHNIPKYLPNINSFDDLIVDESEWTVAYSFTPDIVKHFVQFLRKTAKFAGRIFYITATPGPLEYFSSYFNITKYYSFSDNKFLRPQRVFKVPYQGVVPISALFTHFIHTHLSQIQQGEKVVINCEPSTTDWTYQIQTGIDYITKTSHIGRFGETTTTIYNQLVKAFPQLKIHFINSKNKFQHPLENGELGDGNVFVCTSVINSGLNIYNTDVKHILIASTKTDVIQQFYSRFRAAEFDLWLFWDVSRQLIHLDNLPTPLEVQYLPFKDENELYSHFLKYSLLKQEGEFNGGWIDSFFTKSQVLLGFPQKPQSTAPNLSLSKIQFALGYKLEVGRRKQHSIAERCKQQFVGTNTEMWQELYKRNQLFDFSAVRLLINEDNGYKQLKYVIKSQGEKK